MIVIFAAGSSNAVELLGDITDNGTENGKLKFKIEGVEHSYDDASVKKFSDTMEDPDRKANTKALLSYINKQKKDIDQCKNQIVYDGVDKDETKHPKLQGVAASLNNGVVTLQYSYLNSRLVQGTLLFVATVGSLAGGYFLGKSGASHDVAEDEAPAA